MYLTVKRLHWTGIFQNTGFLKVADVPARLDNATPSGTRHKDYAYGCVVYLTVKRLHWTGIFQNTGFLKVADVPAR
ncbi:hypothetical protein KQY10_20335, partial [Leptospira interrogans]|nr:hypothetical protein [Leptospira interrogans]